MERTTAIDSVLNAALQWLTDANTQTAADEAEARATQTAKAKQVDRSHSGDGGNGRDTNDATEGEGEGEGEGIDDSSPPRDAIYHTAATRAADAEHTGLFIEKTVAVTNGYQDFSHRASSSEGGTCGWSLLPLPITGQSPLRLRHACRSTLFSTIFNHPFFVFVCWFLVFGFGCTRGSFFAMKITSLRNDCSFSLRCQQWRCIEETLA